MELESDADGDLEVLAELLDAEFDPESVEDDSASTSCPAENGPEASGKAQLQQQEEDVSILAGFLEDSDFEESTEAVGDAHDGSGSSDATRSKDGSANENHRDGNMSTSHPSDSQQPTASVSDSSDDLRAQLSLLQQQMNLLQEKLNQQQTASNKTSPPSQSKPLQLIGEGSGCNPFFGEDSMPVLSVTKMKTGGKSGSQTRMVGKPAQSLRNSPASALNGESRTSLPAVKRSSAKSDQPQVNVPKSRQSCLQKETPETSAADCPQTSVQASASGTGPTRKQLEKDLFGDADSDAEDEYGGGRELSQQGREIKQLLQAREAHRQAHTATFQPPSWKKNLNADTALPANNQGAAKRPGMKPSEDENASTDPFSGIRLVNPLVSSSQMSLKMRGRRMMRCSRLHLKLHTADLQGDWVTMGVIVKKSDPKKSSTGKTFSIWTLSDLVDCDHTCSFFLFGQVFKEHWKCSVGTAVGLLNPSLMDPSDRSKEDVAFTISHPNQLMVMGQAKDLGWCQGKTKAGNSCTNFVNKQYGNYCTYHVQAAYRRTSSKRTELQGITGVAPKRYRNQFKKKDDSIYFYGGETFSFGRTLAEARKGRITLTKLQQEHQRSGHQTVTTVSMNNLKPAVTTGQSRSLANDEKQLFLNSLLAPSAGSMNLVKHLVNKEKSHTASKGAGPRKIVSVTPGQLLKEHKAQMEENRRKRQLLGNQTASAAPRAEGVPSSQTGSPASQVQRTPAGQKGSLLRKSQTATSTGSLAASEGIQEPRKKKPLLEISPGLSQTERSPTDRVSLAKSDGSSSRVSGGAGKELPGSADRMSSQGTRRKAAERGGSGSMSARRSSPVRSKSEKRCQSSAEKTHRSKEKSLPSAQQGKKKADSSADSPVTSPGSVPCKRAKSKSGGNLACSGNSSLPCPSELERKPNRSDDCTSELSEKSLKSDTVKSLLRDRHAPPGSENGHVTPVLSSETSSPGLGTAAEQHGSSRVETGVTLKLPVPTLGRGFSQGQDILLDMSNHRPKASNARLSAAKLKAIAKVKADGGLSRSDPNSVRAKSKKPADTEQLRKRVQEKIDADAETTVSEAPPSKRSRLLGNVDLQSPEVQKLLKVRSSHAGAVAVAEMEREDKFLNELEKKEKMEEKMMSIKEMDAILFSCKQCKYTAFGPAEVCKKENHNIVRHKGKKRFFKCRKCGERTLTFEKFPTKPCSKCGEHSYDRTSMYKERAGPKLDSEKLNIRGDEIKFLSSLNEKVYLE